LAQIDLSDKGWNRKKDNIIEEQQKSWAPCFKTSYGRNLGVLIIRMSFLPGRPFQTNILLAGKVRILPLNGIPERSFTHMVLLIYIRLGRKCLPEEKYSILRTTVDYVRKNFYNIVPG
jgi:hypothetical protein